MSSEERSAWVMLVVTIIAYGTYLVIVLGQSTGPANPGPLAEAPYVPTMLWSIGGAILASILLNIVSGILSPRTAGKKDVRDRDIYRFGERIGQSFLVIGGVAALALAMLEAPYFWIANAVYLAFVLSSVFSSTSRVIAYRRGLPSW
jgi:hypothetical protein